MPKFSYIFFFVFLCACQNTPIDKTVIWQQEVNALETIDQKIEFLEELYTSLAGKRTAVNNAMFLSGRNSEEHLKIKEEYKILRREALGKTEAYLNTFGYPSIMKLGSMAAYAPIFVIQNCDDLESRQRNFTILYDGYAFGDITTDAFYRYLASMYYLEYKVDFIPNNKHDAKTQIKAILKALQYE